MVTFHSLGHGRATMPRTDKAFESTTQLRLNNQPYSPSGALSKSSSSDF
jgi:hypothetical protein